VSHADSLLPDAPDVIRVRYADGSVRVLATHSPESEIAIAKRAYLEGRIDLDGFELSVEHALAGNTLKDGVVPGTPGDPDYSTGIAPR
jgi:hypothetical protein